MCSTWANILYEQCAWCFELLNSKTGEPIPLAKLQISLERNFLKLREAIAKDAPSSIIILHVNLMVHFLWEMFVQNGKLIKKRQLTTILLFQATGELFT
jgi:hypothetical protein